MLGIETQESQEGVCRCCLAEGRFKRMDHRFNTDIPTESCADMLLTTFSITFEQPRDVSVDGANLICSLCETRLLEAHTFRQQVVDAQSNFMLKNKTKLLTVRLERLDTGTYNITMPECEAPLESQVSDIEMDAGDEFSMNTIPPAEPKKLKYETVPVCKMTTVGNGSKGRRYRPRQKVERDRKKPTELKNNYCNSKGNSTVTKKVYVEKKCHFCELSIRPFYGDVCKHLQIKHGVEPIEIPDVFTSECDICKETFTSCKKKVMHLKRKHYKCRKCPKVCRNVYELEEHARTHGFRCNKCNESFFTSNQRLSHSRRVHKFQCKECMMIFNSDTSREKHMIIVHGAPELVCGACGKTFDLRKNYNAHQRRDHLMERNYKCTECDYASFTPQLLTCHMYTHSDVKNFECAFCNKKFSHPKTLRNHVRIHTGVKPHVCKQCGASFVQRASLKYHLDKYHPNND